MRRFTMKCLVFSAVVTFFSLSPALALDLDDAKQRGLVGEQHTGYLAAVDKSPSKEVSDLVARINEKRRAKYQAIAAKNGTDIAAVEKLAAEKAIKLTAQGLYVNTGNGWQKK